MHTSLSLSLSLIVLLLSHTGKKAGYLGSAYFVGSFTGSLLWGWISDKIVGRRPVLLMGMLGTLATELLFGFSQNFAWAITARFLWSLLNGNLGVAKTYISEVIFFYRQAPAVNDTHLNLCIHVMIPTRLKVLLLWGLLMDLVDFRLVFIVRQN